jgi:hypothetical protein
MTESSRPESHVPLEDSIPQASLESILCTEELHRRPWRSPDYEKENRALVALVGALADSPCTILQTLAETILDITQCDSAGLSLLTRDGKTPDVSGARFYWPAIAGIWNPARIHRPQTPWPPPAEQDADTNALHPKHLLERRRALVTLSKIAR